MPETTNPDALLIEQVRRGKPEAWKRLIAEYEGRLLAFVESRLWEGPPGGQRGRGAGNVHRPVDQPAELRRPAAARGLPVLDRRAQADRPPAPRGPPPRAPAEFHRRLRRRRLGPARQRPGGEQHRPQRRAARAWRKRRWPRRSPTSSTAGARRATGRRSWSWSCCSPRAGATSRSAEELGLTEQQVANFKFDFLARLRSEVRKAAVERGRVS